MAVPHYDAIVVGVGAHGSAALYHLAKRGVKVLGLERFDHVAHSHGSSHGLSRIIRLAYHEHPSYVPLLLRAYKLWRELQAESGQEVLRITGSVETADASHPLETSVFATALEAAQQYSLEHEVLTGQQCNERWPGYQLPHSFKALYQPEGGILASERCIQAHTARAQAHGAQLHTSCQVTGWHVQPDGRVHVATRSHGSFTCDRLVLTAGSWMSELVPQLKVIGWFEPKQPEHFMPDTFPVWIVQDQQLGSFYGFPLYDHTGMKLGKFNHLRGETDPSCCDRQIHPVDEQLLRDCVVKFFPGADGPMSHAASCMFTNSTDCHFIIDHHPQHKQVVVCSACSGHGFKFSSVIGEILADLTLKRSTEFDLDFLKIDAARPGHSAVLQEPSKL